MINLEQLSFDWDMVGALLLASDIVLKMIRLKLYQILS